MVSSRNAAGARHQGINRAPKLPTNHFVHKTGSHQRKTGKAERTETASKAIARKQTVPYTKIFAWLAIFALGSAALYLYLNFVVSGDDDLEDE